MRAKDYAEVVALFDNKTVEELAKMRSGGAISAAASGRAVDQVKFKKADGPYIHIEIRFSYVGTDRSMARPYPKKKGYIFLLGNGKIKYDPLCFHHPLQRAFGIIPSMDRLCRTQAELQSNDGSEKMIKMKNNIWNAQVDLLNEIGIPTFGLNKDQMASEQEENLKKCITWLVEESRTWDTGEPKIPLPQELFEELLDKSGLK